MKIHLSTGNSKTNAICGQSTRRSIQAQVTNKVKFSEWFSYSPDACCEKCLAKARELKYIN